MKRLLLATVFVFPLFLLAAGFASAADDSKVKEAGQAAEPLAKSAWRSARDSAVGVGTSVKRFFTNLF